MSNRDGKGAKRRDKKSDAKIGDKCPACTPLKGKPRQPIKLDSEGHAKPVKHGYGKGCKLVRCNCGCMDGVSRDDKDVKHNVFCPGCKWSNF